MDALPEWLTAPSEYDPVPDRSSYLRKNILTLTSVLLALRDDPQTRANGSACDRILERVSPAARLVGMLAVVTCVSLARNFSFVWVVLVGWLVMVAMQPASRIRATLVPALVAAAVAFAINVPALFFGQATAPIRMAAKTLVTVGIVASVASSLTSEGVLRGLRSLHVPSHVVMVLDIALRDMVLLGESARSLSEALMLRSVGRDRTKTSSAAGVLGVVFLRAHTMAMARAEAMELRGYDGRAVVGLPTRSSVGLATFGYLATLALVVGLCAYLELSFA